MGAMRYYEVVLVIEAGSSAAANKAANAAYDAVDARPGCAVWDSVATERLADASPKAPRWPDWTAPTSLRPRIGYEDA